MLVSENTILEARKQRHRDKCRERKRELRAERLEKVLCPRCGSEREDKDYQLCNKCREKKRNADADNMQRGLCRNCGGSREDLTTQHCTKCKEFQRTTGLKKKYSITVEDYTRMSEEQGGVCWICKRTTDTGNLHIDHCHETGKVRGLLCGKCNRAIGCLDHSPELLKRAIEYLNKER